MRVGSRRPGLPAAVSASLGLRSGERVLAAAVDDDTGAYVVATTFALVVVPQPASERQPPQRRPWHLVDSGVWQHETSTLTVTWVDGARPGQWTFRDQRTLLPETLRERVQASVVLATRLTLGGRRSARVAIRQDLATRELIPQTVLARGTRADDAEVADQISRAMADLLDQVGLAP